MTDEQIYQKIEETYNSEKGKGFITHLLRSFFPVHKTHKLLLNDKNYKMVDCITGEKLCDADTAIKHIHENLTGDVILEDLKAGIEGKEGTRRKELNEKFVEENGVIAFTCEGSNKLMSHQTVQQLLNFYQSQILMGNKHIYWVANDERGKEFVKSGKKQGFIKNKKEERVVKKASTRAKMSLGDLDVLKDLKKRMEKDEK